MELLGYATGNGHLYLVYEYIQNGSLSEHLHDPLLKGSFSLPTLTSHIGSVTIVAFFFYVLVLVRIFRLSRFVNISLGFSLD